mgnify:FL=1
MPISSELLDEICKTIEVFAAAREFSTDREDNVYIWGDFGDLEMRTLRKAIENLHPAAQITFNPLHIEPGPDWLSMNWN